MNKENKYRVWDKEIKGWFNGHALWLSSVEGHILTIEDKDKKDRFIFQQYTGLRDRNGVEIWEGDIIVEAVQNEFGSFSKEIPLEVYFNSVTGAFRGKDKNDEVHDWSIGKNYEIIGNILEHSELLNK